MSACHACAKDNPPEAKFCAGCGTPLGLRCPSCDAPAQPDARFCTECGTAVATTTEAPPSPPAVTAGGERKQITVLFADVAGSMDLQEQLDPEVWAQIMGRFVAILAEGVRRYGGTVDKFTGDGIMALFGAPIAQEDHARRACHAAWHLTKTVGQYAEELRRDESVELHVRLGLSSGEVVVGRVGDDVTLDPTALGHTVGLAQRMEAMAEPGRAYLTEHTARLVRGWFELRDLGSKPVKGSREPICVYALGSPVSGRAQRSVGASPMVGRERELAILDDAMALAMDGHAQVVGVVGEAGVGKSRLCEEFAVSAVSRGITVRRTSGVSHGKDVPLLPILALLRDYFAVADSDTAEAARQKVALRLLGLDSQLEDDLPVLFDFLEIPDPARPPPKLAPEVRMRRIFHTLRRATARRSEREVLILVVEDLQWFDPQSEAFLERLVDSFPGSRTLVLTNFRPDFSAPWMRHSYYRQLPLTALRDEAVGQLLGGLLGVDLSLAPLLGFIVERTGGNPFFVEEVVRSLIEDGTLGGQPGNYRLTRPLHKVKVPPSVEAVVAARIDRLADEHKAVLQTAAVIGRTFAEPVLSRVTGLREEELEDSLATLCANELLQHTGNHPFAEYRFWHPLTQEVAYGSVLAGRRRRLHAAVAQAIIEFEPDRLDERAALIATHFEAAGEDLEAARWNARAAIWARRTDFSEAIRRWRAVATLLSPLPETEETLRLAVRARARLLQFGARLGVSIDEAERLYAEGKALAERLGDAAELVSLTRFLGTAQVFRGDFRDGLASWGEAVRLADRTEDVGLRVSCWTNTPFAQRHTGPLGEALRLADHGLALCQGDPDIGSEITGWSDMTRTLFVRADLLAVSGRLDEARQEADHALSLACQRSEMEFVAWTLSIYPRLARYAGEDLGSHARAVEGIRIADDSGNVAARIFALQGLGVAELDAGRGEHARTALIGALEQGRATGVRMEEASVLAYLALAHLACREANPARQAADEAVAVAKRQGASVLECFSLLTRAQVLRAVDAPRGEDRILADLNAALALVRESGAVSYEPFIREELGRVHGLDELREALRLYQQIGATGHACRLETELSTGSPA